MKILTLPTPSSEPDVIKCRHCGSTQVRPSHKSSGTSSRTLYRCQACKRHFRVGSGRSRIQYVFAGVVLLVLVLIGLLVSQLMTDTAEVAYQPRVDMLNRAALAKTQQDAKQGNTQAQYDLGWTYWQNAEYQQALPWIKAAAEHGHSEAEYLLGMAYLNGRGTLQNYHAALEQFTKAAEHNHLEAEYRLGIFYRDGLATPPNKEAAYLWLNIAAARGHEEALHYRDKLAFAMTTEEITHAQEASAKAMTKLSVPAASKP
jgi:TPR repeat protein